MFTRKTLVLTLAVALAACNHTRPEPQPKEVGGAMMLPTQTLVENASTADNLTTLVTLVTQAGLAETLGEGGPFTVFAPLDDAFADLPAEVVLALLAPENVDTLRGVLSHHVVEGVYTSADLKDDMELTALDGSELTVQKEGDSIWIDGIAVVVSDVFASNGIAHVVDTVLLPPQEGEEMDDDMDDEEDNEDEDEEDEDDMMGDKGSDGSVYAPFNDSVIGNGEASVLFFNASWCGKCKKHDEMLSSWYEQNDFAVSAYSVDFDSSDALKSKYGVVKQDTFVRIDGEGNLVSSVMAPTEDALMDLLN